MAKYYALPPPPPPPNITVYGFQILHNSGLPADLENLENLEKPGNQKGDLENLEKGCNLPPNLENSHKNLEKMFSVSTAVR